MLQLLAQTTAAATDPAAAQDFGYYCGLSTLFGVVEGLTEFLPVSSTAHLRIAQYMTGVDLEAGYWKMYSVVIQLGAILSVPILFRERIVDLVKNFPKGDSGTKTIYTHPLSLVMIGFLVTAGPCYLADHYIGANLSSLMIMAIALVAGGIAMWVVDALCTKPKIKKMEGMTILQAVWIGAVQVLSAIFPGTSRSMSTIAAGQVLGLSRSAAVEYSFFLSLPTMLAATVYKFMQDLLHHKTAEEAAKYGAPPQPWVILAIGFILSFVVALAVNGWFITWVKRHGFVPFAIYRILLGAAILVWLFTMGNGQ